MCLLGCAGNITLNSNVNLRAAIKRSFFELTLAAKDSALLAMSAFRVPIQLCRWISIVRRRLQGWLRVLKDNDSSPGVRGWLAMVSLAIKASVVRPERAQIISNYRACWRCPVFDRHLRRCGSEVGIGCLCYQPFALVAGKPCWGRENVPGFEFGY